uniref:TEN1 subunit of CST complex n=1 Tax=Erpetoichthys calabaricus TaxID=27687 RepID=A0A8C4T567_ERPCA
MLPMPGVFRFPWEFSSGAVQPGETLRTYGRLACYKAEESEATLTAHDGTSDCQVCVCTQLVEPFQAITGAPYVTLGEAVRREGEAPEIFNEQDWLTDYHLNMWHDEF